ncbi:MAG TPA: YciI family protein [Chloroflexota bacterium]|nr:YciI family protein [Chloroflexota bacterium]
MKYVLFYESAADIRTMAPPYFAAHRARWADIHAAGTLLMIGPFADAADDSAMAVFTTRAAAEDFARCDPFVLHGVVRAWHIRTWNEALTAP